MQGLGLRPRVEVSATMQGFRLWTRVGVRGGVGWGRGVEEPSGVEGSSGVGWGLGLEWSSDPLLGQGCGLQAASPACAQSTTTCPPLAVMQGFPAMSSSPARYAHSANGDATVSIEEFEHRFVPAPASLTSLWPFWMASSSDRIKRSIALHEGRTSGVT